MKGIDTMKKDTQEKSLIKVNDNNIFRKIINFIKNIFVKNKAIYDNSSNIEQENNEISIKEDNKSSFIESIKNIEDEETKLLKLQKQYRSGEIKGEDLTDEQIMKLCGLYDRQIENLKKSNEARKAKLREYRKKLQAEG